MIMDTQYKQKIFNVDYNEDLIGISLGRGEWNSVSTWIESSTNTEYERVGKEWFEDLHELYMKPISNELNFSGKEFGNHNIPFEIPRKLLRYFVFSVGRIAYDLDAKSTSNIYAQGILVKINKQISDQLNNTDDWYKYGY